MPASCRLATRPRGYSLIETVLATAIAAALAAVGLPRLSHLLDQYRLTATVNEFVLAVQLARSESVRRHQRVTIAARDGRSWASGWIVFVDEDGNGLRGPDEAVLLVYAGVPERMSIEAHFGIYHGRALAFDHVGRPRRPGSDALLLGRMLVRLGTGTRSVCFSTATVRTVRAAQCA